jgi:hypothetical protein
MGGGCLASWDAQSEGRSGDEDGSWYVAEMWEVVWAVNKQLVESPMGAASEYRGYTWHRRLQCPLFMV